MSNKTATTQLPLGFQVLNGETFKTFYPEDNAQAHGASYDNKKTGGLGLISATSFYPAKNLGALGDAGAINTNDTELFTRIKLLRNYGSPDKHKFEYQGVNSRMDELQAALLQIQIGHLDNWNNQRRHIARMYNHRLSEISEINLMRENNLGSCVYHIYPILTEKRDRLRQYLDSRGISTLRHYPQPFYLEKAFSEFDYKKEMFQTTEQICRTELSLPIYPGLSDEKVEFICEKISDFFKL